MQVTENHWLLITIAIATPVIMVAALTRVAALLGGGPNASVTTSLSYADLLDFALADADRSEVLKTYFAWKHDVLLEMLKVVAAFALANLALAIKFVVDPDSSAVVQMQELTGLKVGPSILAGFGAVLLVAVWLTLRLRRLPAEYSAAIRFVDMVR